MAVFKIISLDILKFLKRTLKAIVYMLQPKNRIIMLIGYVKRIYTI